MQSKPDHPVMTRHARLFELLRQESMALRARAANDTPLSADQNTLDAFRKMAERSFVQGNVTL